MKRVLYASSAAALLAALWGGPLPALAVTRFSAHMLLHMGVVAIAAPLMALVISGSRLDPVRRWPAVFSPLLASVVELLVVWGWHAPVFHHGARSSLPLLILEQGSFLVAGLWLWLGASGGGAADTRRAWSGVAALLLTSMHMTLLGAVFALAPRPMYGADSPAALADQHVGGAVMLLVGGTSYLAGALWLAWRGIRTPPIAARGTA